MHVHAYMHMYTLKQAYIRTQHTHTHAHIYRPHQVDVYGFALKGKKKEKAGERVGGGAGGFASE